MDDCFALYINKVSKNDCSALKLINCNKCKFYRNDIKRSEIEMDIRKYQFGGNKTKKK